MVLVYVNMECHPNLQSHMVCHPNLQSEQTLVCFLAHRIQLVVIFCPSVSVMLLSSKMSQRVVTVESLSLLHQSLYTDFNLPVTTHWWARRPSCEPNSQLNFVTEAGGECEGWRAVKLVYPLSCPVINFYWPSKGGTTFVAVLFFIFDAVQF